MLIAMSLAQAWRRLMPWSGLHIMAQFSTEPPTYPHFELQQRIDKSNSCSSWAWMFGISSVANHHWLRWSSLKSVHLPVPLIRRLAAADGIWAWVFPCSPQLWHGCSHETITVHLSSTVYERHWTAHWQRVQQWLWSFSSIVESVLSKRHSDLWCVLCINMK